MKERPIVFTGEMVRAILEGRKTMTRRPVKPQPRKFSPERERQWNPHAIPPGGSLPEHWSWWEGPAHGPSMYHRAKCPYGKPGDRLWVKETYRYHPEDKPLGDQMPIDYAATPISGDGFLGLKWKSSRFMPRWASRILLEIVSVRVERVQEISRGDAGLEGMCFLSDINWNKVHKGLNVIQKHHWPEENFSRYWDTIYAKNPESQWDANPWVWVIEFKVVKA